MGQSSSTGGGASNTSSCASCFQKEDSNQTQQEEEIQDKASEEESTEKGIVPKMSEAKPNTRASVNHQASVEKIFGDERDLIASRLISNGGSRAFVVENLKTNRRRYTHDPLPAVNDVDETLHSTGSRSIKRSETPFVSNPLDQKIRKKVSIVGCGQVGLATAYSILNQGLCDSLVLVDVNGTRLEGEVKDFQQASAFAKRCTVEGSTNYDVTVDSDLVIVTAGAKQKPGESRLNLLNTNVKIMKSIVEQILEYSPEAPICIVSNPCDVMTAVAAKIAKDLPPGRIFGSGTVLDTGRFRQLIASSLNLDVRAVSGYVIGEHGNSSLAVWSSVQIGGVRLLKPGTKPGALENAIHAEVVGAAGEVIEKKGYTNWAVGMACAEIAEAVLNDMRLVMPVSTCVRGYAGVNEDVFLSVPSVVGAYGVKRVFDLDLTSSEKALFKKSAAVVWDAQTDVWESF